MNKILSPDINLYSDILSYLQDFYSLNKAENKNFSYNYLAMMLGWSAPYLNDLIKGRKKLSLKRALEFIEFVELKGSSAERFLFLFLSDGDHQFSTSQLNKNALAAHNSKKVVHEEVSREEFEKFETLFDLYILYYLDYAKGLWNEKSFLATLDFPIKPSSAFLQTCIQRMIKNKFIKPTAKENEFEIIFVGGVVLDQHEEKTTDEHKRRLNAITKQEIDYAESYRNYLDGQMKKYFLCSGVINLNDELLAEAKDRFFAFRNYLYELDQRAQAGIAEAPSANSRVWQFSMHMFSLFEDSK